MVPGPATVTINKAKRIAGKARNTSMTRITAMSRQPPHQAANRPMIVPAMLEMATDATAMTKEVRTATTRRLNTSRPNRSVPMMCVPLGPCRRSIGTWARGSKGTRVTAPAKDASP